MCQAVCEAPGRLSQVSAALAAAATSSSSSLGTEPRAFWGTTLSGLPYLTLTQPRKEVPPLMTPILLRSKPIPKGKELVQHHPVGKWQNWIQPRPAALNHGPYKSTLQRGGKAGDTDGVSWDTSPPPPRGLNGGLRGVDFVLLALEPTPPPIPTSALPGVSKASNYGTQSEMCFRKFLLVCGKWGGRQTGGSRQGVREGWLLRPRLGGRACGQGLPAGLVKT